MKKITDIELKAISVEILKNVDAFCRENRIEYSIAYGTLIGAVRHKGFIPWDDDIDIMMTRDNYNRFLESFNKVDNSPYKVRYYGNFKGYPYPAAKVEDTRTINYDISYNKLGVAIDVFAVDKLPKKLKDAKRVKRKAHMIWYVYCLKFMKWRKGRNFLKNSFAVISKLITFFISYKYLGKKIDSIATANNNSSSDIISHYLSAYGLRDVHNIEMFIEYSDIEFEGSSFRCIKEYDKFLTTVYGDYMKLPPVEKRISTHSPNAFWR